MTEKKLMIIVLAVTLLLTGCGGQSTSADEAEGPAAQAVSPLDAEDALPTRQAIDDVFSLYFDPEGGTNPLQAENAANMQFWSLLYDSVFTVDENFDCTSDIVETVDSDDYTWWVFHMYSGLQFSDGTPLTASDVVYSIRRAGQSDYYQKRLSGIYGISALDDTTFAITTSYADSQFPALLNIPIIKNGDYFEDWPIGSGPYVLNEDHTALELNRLGRYADEMPIDTIYLKNYADTSGRITAFENAALDLVTNDPTGMFNLGYGSTNEIRYYDTSNLHYIGFNMKGMYFQYFRIRQAMGYAIDRDYITEELMSGCGTPTALPVHPKSALYDAEYAQQFTYDPEQALALLNAAGLDDLDGDGENELLVTGIVVELDIKFIVNNDSSAKVAAARQICQELNDMGVTTNLYELSWSDYMKALETGDYDMYYGELRMTPDWDLSDLFRIYEGRRNPDLPFEGMNYAQNTDSTYCELYSAYLAAPEAERAAAFQEVLQYIGEGAPILPICFERRQILTHRGVVSGINATQYDLFHNFSDWTIDLND